MATSHIPTFVISVLKIHAELSSQKQYVLNYFEARGDLLRLLCSSVRRRQFASHKLIHNHLDNLPML